MLLKLFLQHYGKARAARRILPVEWATVSFIAPERCGLIVQYIPAVAKDIFVYIVGPRRSVNIVDYFNCTV